MSATFITEINESRPEVRSVDFDVKIKINNMDSSSKEYAKTLRKIADNLVDDQNDSSIYQLLKKLADIFDKQ